MDNILEALIIGQDDRGDLFSKNYVGTKQTIYLEAGSCYQYHGLRDVVVIMPEFKKTILDKLNQL